MNKKRGTIVAVIATVVISAISLGIAFASLSTTLRIDLNTKVESNTWNVFFDDDLTGTGPTGEVNKTIAGTAVSTTATLTSTVFTGGVTLKNPGDSVTYDFYARNTGDFNAKVSNVIEPTLTCTFADNTDATTFCNEHVKYGVYKNAECTEPVSQNDQLAAKTGSAHYYVKIELRNNFAADGSDLHTQDVTVAASPVVITYAQDGGVVY